MRRAAVGLDTLGHGDVGREGHSGGMIGSPRARLQLGGLVIESSDRRVVDLPRRLREETSNLHRSVEDGVDLPASVRTRGEYVDLLDRFFQLHAPLEQRLASSVWGQRWAEHGIDLERHARAHLLADDLFRLDAAPSSRPVFLPQLRTFGEALGCLYVLEGSSLGGQVLAPAIRSAVGDVPVSFLAGEGREHTEPWRAVREALRRFDARQADSVVLGARGTFAAFGAHLGCAAPAGCGAG